jgi:hypothetical protein
MVSLKEGPSEVADALFSKGRQRVLALFFGQPERRAYVRQVERMAGTGLGSVQRELARLTAAGLLLREREGHQTYYRANPMSPAFDALRDLVARTLGTGGRLSEELLARRPAVLAAAARRGARNVRVFGSVARGEARADSDVDLLVDLEPGRSLLDLGGLTIDLEEILGRKVDIVTPAGLSPRIRANVLREARKL